jgi:hypothetical protein
MADASLRDELESFKRQFEMLQVGEAECHLVTTKSAILTKHPVRRVIVKCQSEPWDYWCMEGGIELLPERILSVQDLKDAVPLYDFDGKLVETPNGELMFKTGGWSVSHCFYFRGRGYRGISKLIERINLWACEHRRWLNRIGLIPPIAQKQGLQLWSEVVLSVAENSGSTSIAKPEWYVTARPGLRINVKMLNQSACKGVFGVTQDEIDRLILEPQEIESSREDFVGDSIAVITELIKRSTQAESEQSPKADDGDELPRLALKAVIDGGDPGLISQAIKVPAKQRYSMTMMSMLREDRSYYEWSLEEWANHLGASKPTIQSTDAWREIMKHREQNKQDRAGK